MLKQPPATALVRHRVVAERRGDELWIFNRDAEGQGNEPDLEQNLRAGEALVQPGGRNLTTGNRYDTIMVCFRFCDGDPWPPSR